MVRPAGRHGELVLVGRGRDLRTESDGTPVMLATASYRALVDFLGGWTLTELSTIPDRPPLRGLLGGTTGSGFRAKVAAVDPGIRTSSPLLHQLLDDVPVTTLVSGHAYSAATAHGDGYHSRRPDHTAFGRDMCAGFADGGTIMHSVDTTGRAPLVSGPIAPALTTSDRLAWHELPTLTPHAMRRSRRIDVRPGAEPRVDVLFRDSYVRADGVETVIHEYTVEVVLEGGLVHSCVAHPRVLPWVECPAAVASARRLEGVPLAGLRQHVRETFVGTSTCTHLNDTLRALEDVPMLLSSAG